MEYNGLNGTIKIQREEYRPCLVSKVVNRLVKTEEALFHRWVDVSKLVDASPMIGGHPGGTVSHCVGLVEYDNGQIEEVKPESITFIDGLVHSERVSDYRKCYEEYWNKQKEKENENG